MFTVLAKPLVASEEAACDLIREQSLRLLSAGLFMNMKNTCAEIHLLVTFLLLDFLPFQLCNLRIFSANYTV